MEIKNKQPRVGDHVGITWLPSCINARYSDNPYVGMVGFVDYLYDNGGFCINTGNSILCITRDEYKYRVLHREEQKNAGLHPVFAQILNTVFPGI